LKKNRLSFLMIFIVVYVIYVIINFHVWQMTWFLFITYPSIDSLFSLLYLILTPIVSATFLLLLNWISSRFNLEKSLEKTRKRLIQDKAFFWFADKRSRNSYHESLRRWENDYVQYRTGIMSSSFVVLPSVILLRPLGVLMALIFPALSIF